LLPTLEEWGYPTPPIEPNELVTAVREAAVTAIANYNALPEPPEPCHDCAGYSRAAVSFKVGHKLADQLMNGATGYRAHYYVSESLGEALNRSLVDAVAPLFVAATALYADRYSTSEFSRSLLGRFSKLWFPKSLTDEANTKSLKNLQERIVVPRWMSYWRNRAIPKKGLLAPACDEILLNGTFINEDGDFEQKPNRSKDLWERGWV
jgi:hypothetical protein